MSVAQSIDIIVIIIIVIAGEISSNTEMRMSDLFLQEYRGITMT